MTTNGQDVKALLAKARRPERTVKLYLVDLRDQITELEEQLAALGRPGMLTPSPEARGVAERIEALRQEMADSLLVVRVRAMARPAWRRLMSEHLPRRDSNNQVLDEDATGVNAETFFPAIIRACLAEPTLDNEDWQTLLDALSPAQFDQLSSAAWAVNRGDVDVPKSRAASRILQNSEPESKQPTDSASA